MLYYTQLIYVKPGKEQLFQAFENNVLPLLERYGGRLLYRVRPGTDQVISSSIGQPYEVHLVTFPTKDAFLAYANDEERKRFTGMKDESVERSLLIEGIVI